MGRQFWASQRFSLLPFGDTRVSLGAQSGVSSQGAKPAESGEEGEFICTIGQGQP